MDFSSLLKMLNPEEEANATPIPHDDAAVPDPTAQLPPLATQSGAQAGLMSSDTPGVISTTVKVPPPMIQKGPAVASNADSGEDAGGPGNGSGSDVAGFIAKKYGFNPLMDNQALQNAQNSSNQQQLMANLGQAFDKIGSSIARTKESPEAQAFYQNLQEQAKNPVKDIIQQRQAAAQGQQFAQEQENADPNSTKATITRKFYAPQMQKLGLDSNSLNGLSAIDQKEFAQKAIENAAAQQSREEIAKLRQATVASGRQDKADQKSAQRFTTFGEALDENKGRTGEFGRQAQFVNNADRILVLANQFPDGNIPKAQMSELAVSTANLLGGGNGAAAETVNRFVPHTLSGSAAGITEWLTANPTGTGQQAFAKMMFDTAKREKDLASNKINAVKMSRVAQFSDLEKKDPQLFNNILESHGVDPELYAKYKQGGYKLPASSPAPASSSHSVDQSDPRVQKAKALGYSEQEIQEYLNAKR